MDTNKNVSINILAFFLIMGGVAIGIIGLSAEMAHQQQEEPTEVLTQNIDELPEEFTL